MRGVITEVFRVYFQTPEEPETNTTEISNGTDQQVDTDQEPYRYRLTTNSKKTKIDLGPAAAAANAIVLQNKGDYAVNIHPGQYYLPPGNMTVIRSYHLDQIFVSSEASNLLIVTVLPGIES